MFFELKNHSYNFPASPLRTRVGMALIALISFLLPADAHSDRLLRERANEFLKKVESGKAAPDERFSFMAVELGEKGELIAALNEKELYAPASVLKILTTYAALKRLGAEYRFPTEVFVDRLPKEQDVSMDRSSGLNPDRPVWKLGNLYVRGYGDPTMVDERLWEMARAIRRRGVREVENLVIDDTLFHEPPGPTGSEPYEAGPSATALNHNCYAVHVSPYGATLPAFVELTPGAPFKLVNRVKSLRSAEQSVTVTQSVDSVGYNPVLAMRKSGKYRVMNGDLMTVTVQGYLGLQTDVVTEYRTVPDPASYYGAVLKNALAENGIPVSGSIMFGETPSGSKPLLVYESYSLVRILYDLNHYSSNFIAAQLVYALGQDEKGKFRYDLGLSRIAEILEGLGFERSSFNIADGSGLSRDNKLSVEQLLRAMLAMSSDFSVEPDFLSSLSRYGRSGTLKSRKVLNEKLVQNSLKSELADLKRRADSVWGKTGTLDGISSLAGYLELESGKRAAFAVISEGVEKSRAARVEDEFVRLLIGAKDS